MFRMLKHHLHPGIFLFFIWLCHLMEHQKVQGKLPSSGLFFFLFLRFWGWWCWWGGLKLPNAPVALCCCSRETFQSLPSFFPPSSPSSVLMIKTLCASDAGCVKASIKQVPYGTLQSETKCQVLQPSLGRTHLSCSL